MAEEYLYRAFGSVKQTESLSFRYDEKDCFETSIYVDALPIIRRTPKGAWIEHPVTGLPKWVATEGRKRFACPTKEEALESLRVRNLRRISHLNNALRKAELIRDNLASDTPVETKDLVNGYFKFKD